MQKDKIKIFKNRIKIEIKSKIIKINSKFYEQANRK